ELKSQYGHLRTHQGRWTYSDSGGVVSMPAHCRSSPAALAVNAADRGGRSAPAGAGWRPRRMRRCDNPAMTDDRIIAPVASREDEAIEASIRPRRLDEYLGQQP